MTDSYQRSYIKLKNLKNGTYSCGERKGFITVEHKKNYITVMWTSRKTSHNFTDGIGKSVVYVEFTENGVLNVMQSAIRMWPVTDTNKKEELISYILDKIDSHYDFKHTQTEYQNKGFWAKLFN